ncbi:MAG TPA: ATP-binding protein, partial [Opitutales bacterium]|nr:ATP-binding protein [Opitutales bacterium]
IARGSSAFYYEGREVAISPFPRQEMNLVLVRESRSFMARGLGDAVLMPTILLTVACACLAYYLARRIVRPLTTLTDWLPHLEHDDRAAPEIPARVSQRQDEIGELARSLGETHRRLREEQRRRRQSERMATLGRIATSLAHEIRNPASSIGLHADLLARNAEASNEESIRLIRTEVDRIGDLVNQWLFVVRPAPPQSGSHDLVALVRRIGESLRTAMEHAGATLCFAELATSPTVSCDHARIEQVVRNLLVNAVQAMPEGGDIRISFETTGENAVLAIHDSGPGFSEDALQRFGEPFFSEREGGMGIGLTLAREVIEAHRGEIHATNDPAGGGVVRVQLPLANSREERHQ